jgi:hypothetical protein
VEPAVVGDRDQVLLELKAGELIAELAFEHVVVDPIVGAQF